MDDTANGFHRYDARPSIKAMTLCKIVSAVVHDLQRREIVSPRLAFREQLIEIKLIAKM